AVRNKYLSAPIPGTSLVVRPWSHKPLNRETSSCRHRCKSLGAGTSPGSDDALGDTRGLMSSRASGEAFLPFPGDEDRASEEGKEKRREALSMAAVTNR